MSPDGKHRNQGNYVSGSKLFCLRNKTIANELLISKVKVKLMKNSEKNQINSHIENIAALT